MKKIIILLFSLCFFTDTFAEDKFRIEVLREISYQYAQSYPRKFEIAKFTYTNPLGVTTTRYFIGAEGIKHNSELVIINSKGNDCPWRIRINGNSYYARFDDDDELNVGDEGVLRYEGTTLYFLKD